MKQFAMLGKWHVHAPGYANEINALPGCRISKVWDPDQSAAKKWAQVLGCEYATLEDIYADPAIDGVIICSATNEHTPLILDACRAGKAVFTEKVLALTTQEALAIKKAVEEHHTRFAISFPHLCRPEIRFALALAQAGKLGAVNYARVRNTHNGATANWLPPHFYDPIACGGGAMMDLGAHPMYLLCALLGMPIRVQSAFTQITGHGVEDNAVSLLQFENGAIGVSETSFVSQHYPFLMEIGGDQGSLLLQDGKVSYCCAETDHQWITPDQLPPALPSPLSQWALSDHPDQIAVDFGIEAALRLTQVMEMAYGR